ncbi:MAG TPA: hypothetical protein VE888_20855 [Streptosporangiaceae bacterium]|nr:hypothetical protein [Streptosporangiaceae bacterium]
MSDIVPRRRVLLASAAALPLLLGAAGCRSADVFTGPDPLAGRPPLGHDVLTLQAVIAAEENMIDLYQLAISGDSGKQRAARARTLRALLVQHEQHLVRLKARLIVPPGTSASSSPSPGGSGSAFFSPGPVGVAQLRAAERASAADLVRRLATAPPALAQLLASIAASDATHATALRG